MFVSIRNHPFVLATTLALVLTGCSLFGSSDIADGDKRFFGSESAGDNYYPSYGNGGYDVSSYDLDLIWDHDERTIDGQATIAFTATQQLSQFNLDLIGFDVTAISVNGADARYKRNGRELVIAPAVVLADGDSGTVIIDYEGKPTTVKDDDDGWMDFGDTIVVAGQPSGASGWYPVNEHPIDKALYRIEVTARADLVVASNGTQTEVTDNGATKTWVYESAHPQASYLTTLAIGDLVRYDDAPSESGVPVRHFFHRTVVDESVATMERTPEMIDVFEDMFGPYPFENYGTVVVDSDLGFVLETQTLSVFGRDFVDLDATQEDIVAHELAHQWFGNHVSLRQWSELWLNESFATYSQYLWREALEPGYDIDAKIRESYAALSSDLDTPAGAPPDDDLFHASIYHRGAFTLHALRTTIGDDAFFEFMTTYVTEFGGGNVETVDLVRVAEEVSGQDLQAFFDAWLFEDGIPPLPA